MPPHQAEAIAKALVTRGLAGESDVDARMAALRSDLDALDAKAIEVLQAFQGIHIITTHPRYAYFAQRYGLSVTALEWEAGAMPNQAQIEELEALKAETGAQVLFWEAEPPAAALDLAADLNLQSVVFAPLAHAVDGGDFLDSLSRDTCLDVTCQASLRSRVSSLKANARKQQKTSAAEPSEAFWYRWLRG